jgi:hypothetical protein
MKKRYFVIGMVFMLLIGTGIGIAIKKEDVYLIAKEINDEEINFVELYFPNVSTGSSPLGNEVFALSFIVEQYQFGYQNYGGRNLVAEVVSGPYNQNRILDMDYNYFVHPLFANYNITLIVRDGQVVDAVVEDYPVSVVWNGVNLTIG